MVAKIRQEKQSNTTTIRNYIQSGLILSLTVFVAVAGIAGFSTVDAAKPKILSMEDGWKLEKRLSWESHPTRVHALVQSQIRISNITDDSIRGDITDPNGTSLCIDGKESVIMARFCYDSGTHSKWKIVAKPSNGLFEFTIPPRYADADYVKLWTNANSFVVQGTRGSTEAEYRVQGAEIAVNDDGIFVIRGAPPLAFVNVSSDEGLDLQEFPVYQGQIKVKVTGAQAIHRLSAGL